MSCCGGHDEETAASAAKDTSTAPEAGSLLATHNWGRWGEGDELGAANHIAADTVVAAASLVRSGRVFSLA